MTNAVNLSAIGANATAGGTVSITSGTAVATTSGTSITFSSIPSWVKRITISLNVIKISGSSALTIQVGSGSVSTTGYNGACSTTAGVQSPFSTNNGFIVNNNMDSGNIRSGTVTLTTLGSNVWVESGSVFPNASGVTGCVSSGSISLSGVLDRVVITMNNGTDTFTAGSVNILYE